jgi:hypothetical protein
VPVLQNHSAEPVASSYVKAGELVRGYERRGQWLERAGLGWDHGLLPARGIRSRLSQAKAAGQTMSGASHSTGFPSGMLCVAYTLPGNEWRSAPGEATVRCRY